MESEPFSESVHQTRSLPSHLDGRRRCHCGECGPSDNNSCGAPTPRHPRHLHKFNHHYGCKSADLEPVWKLQDPGCDQGYGSERSPEEEFPPSMPVEEEYDDQDIDLRQMYPFITDENTFTVRIEKDRRGLGLSVAGGAIVPTGGGGRGPGLVRIRRLYAAQPAWATGQLRPGDLLLAANGISLAGLTTYEALEVLRTTPPIVELVVCRPEPEVLECLTPPGGPPEPPLRQPPPDPLNLHPRRIAAPPPPAPEYEEPQPIFDVKFGEFDIVMTKVNGSLGFTLRKEDHSALGHYVRALVREPALSDGRIQPGDRIVAVNDVPMSTLSHGEAVSFLRRCGPVARLRLYRDHCGTPPSPSAASPTTESDTTLTRPKPPLRQEAVNMLCDIAARKLTPDDGNGSRSPCLSPRRFKKPTRNSTGYSQNSDTMHPYSVNCPSTTAENSDNELSQTLSYQSTDTADTTYSVVTDGRPVRPTCFNGQLFENIKPPSRPDFLDLGGPPTPVNNRKQRLHFSVAAHGYELNNLDNDVLDAPNIYQDISQNGGSAYLMSGQTLQINEMSNEPMSMPIELNSSLDDNEARFSHKNPAYQSAVVHPSTNSSESNKDEVNSMKKWKCVTLSPENERKLKSENSIQKEEPEKPKIVHYPDENKREPGSEPRILTVELNRGWNSRLGFSVQCHPESGQSYISAIYSDSVAAKDGRLRQGDIILQVNDENITSMTTPQVIDLLRILRGSICITVLRQ